MDNYQLRNSKPYANYYSTLSDSVPNLSDNLNVGSKMQENKASVFVVEAIPDNRYISNIIVNDASESTNTNRANKNTIKITNKPPVGEKIIINYKNNYGVSLEEREMPITRERQSKFLNAARRISDGRKGLRSTMSTQSLKSAQSGSKYDSASDWLRKR